MTTRRALNDLEWLGWELAASRLLVIDEASAAILRRLVMAAPQAVSVASLRCARAGVVCARASVSVYISKLRSALGDVGVAGVGIVRLEGGYGFTSEEMAAEVQLAVERYARGEDI